MSILTGLRTALLLDRISAKLGLDDHTKSPVHSPVHPDPFWAAKVSKNCDETVLKLFARQREFHERWQQDLRQRQIRRDR